MSEQGALHEALRSNGPSENFVSIRSEKVNEIQKCIVECANFPHESLPVVVLGASPLKNWCVFPAKNSVDFSGRVAWYCERLIM